MNKKKQNLDYSRDKKKLGLFNRDINIRVKKICLKGCSSILILPYLEFPISSN